MTNVVGDVGGRDSNQGVERGVSCAANGGEIVFQGSSRPRLGGLRKHDNPQLGEPH